LLAGPCLMFLVAQRRPLVVTPALPLMIAYLTVLVISATLAGSSQRNAVTPIITFLSEGLLLYLLVTNAVRNPQHLRMVLWAVIALFAPNYVQRLQSLAGTDSALSQSPAVDGAIQGRATENLAALYVFRDHPLFGVGPGQFFNRYSTDYGNELDMRFLKQNRR